MKFDWTEDPATGAVTYRLTITRSEQELIAASDDADYIEGFFVRDGSRISDKLDGLEILARRLEAEPAP